MYSYLLYKKKLILIYLVLYTTIYAINNMTTKDLTPDEVEFVIFHDPCPDGTGSAYVIWKYLSTKFPDRIVTYHRSSYGKPPDVTGKNVLLCDITFRKYHILNMISTANKLLIIDHHKSAEKDLADIPDKHKIFDMNHSGAVLTWMFFYPDEDMPLLLRYIEDRDIWTKKFPDIDNFYAWFKMVPLEYQEYDKYIDNKILLERNESVGVACRKLDEYYIDIACKQISVKFHKIKNKYYFVGYSNVSISTLKSDIGNAIMKRFPYVDFAVAYSIHDQYDSTSFSLRSTDQHIDVSEIARFFGGGGHRNASGMGISYVTNKLPCVMYDNTRLYYEISKIYFSTLEINQVMYNVVYLNCSVHKSKLANYFLQTKYTDTIPVQSATAILKTQLDDVDFDTQFHIAAVWHYDGTKDITDFSVALHANLDNTHMKNIMSTFDISNGLRYYGYHTTIPLSIPYIS